MSNSLLNLSGKIDPETIALFQCVEGVAKQLNIPFVVVGAYARDLVLHYGYGAAIQRATSDIDFGIQIPNWTAFEKLTERLLENGFEKSQPQHRLVSPEGIQVDIVPFGQLEDERANIQWPPNGDMVMNVLGFQEALDHAEMVRIQDVPSVDIPVATPQGMTLLKLISWVDRAADMRKKDAKDLRYLMKTYTKIPAIMEVLYDSGFLEERYDWDTELAGAHQLGIDAKTIAGEQTYKAVSALFNGEHKKLSVETLVDEMSDQIAGEYEKNKEIIDALIEGFLQEVKS
ncbi:hypothetical protein A9Q81_00095 [Gammaproteobacteria bacterium 42_54_T18]|nr:hypothetical protein A9Q81_00095 [Gammaproteobacteria bacterium 42_54_T18]